MLESELARIRGIDDSAFGTLRKQRERQLTKEEGHAMSKSVQAVIPLLKTKGITIHTPIGKGGQAFVFYAPLQRDEESGRSQQFKDRKLWRRSGDQIIVSRVIR